MQGLRVRVGDRLVVRHIESAAPTISAAVRVLYDSGKDDVLAVAPTLAVADRAVRTIEGGYVAKEAGWVVGGAVSLGIAVSVLRGQCYVYAALSGVGGEVSICRGYAYDNHPVVAGEYVDSGPIGGRGFVRQIGLADPAAGAEFAAQSVPANCLWRVLSFTASLVQGITNTPHPALLFTTATAAAVLALIPIGADVAASTTVRVTWGAVISDTRNNVNGGSMAAAVPDILLNATDEILTSTEGIAATSDYGVGGLVVEEWLVL